MSNQITDLGLGDPEPQRPRPIAGLPIVSMLTSFAKKMSTVAIVYLLGYFNFSVAWLVGPVIYSVIREEWRKESEMKRATIKQTAMSGEMENILARVDDLPSWVFFPDVERAEWVNTIIHRVWPNLNHYVKTVMKETIEPAINESLAAYKLGSFQIQKMNIGSIPPRIGGVKVYDKNISRNEILVDLDVFYAGDCDILIALSGVSGGIKDFQIHGMVRLVMKPLISVIPIVGGLQIFFLKNPSIDFDLVGVANALDMPGLGDLLRRIIVEQVANMMVLPNKINIQLSDDVSAAALKEPEPLGVLRVHVIEAKKLMKMDIGMLGRTMSDPYAIINVGAQEFRTPSINNTEDPKWDYWCEFIVHTPGQPLAIFLKDDDASKSDSELGKATVEINNVANKGELDTWITLEEAKHGLVHLRMSWWKLSSSASDLKAALAETQQLPSMSSAILIVFIDSINDLPNARAKSKPDPFVTVTLNKFVEKTAVQYRTDCPVYEQGFVILVSNPEVDTMHISVTDHKTSKEIGQLNYNVSQLLEKPNMLVESQPFQLKKSGGQSKIILTLRLKILKHDKPKNDDDFDVTVPQQSSLPERQSPSHSRLKKESFFSGPQTFENLNKSARGLHRTNSGHSFSSGGRREHNLGRILLSFNFSVESQRFQVAVHKIVDIPQIDAANIPSPYVKLCLLPDRSKKSYRRTELVRDNCNPIYDQTFDYVISLAELSTRQLEVSVCTKKGLFSSQSCCIGQTLVNLGELNLKDGTTEWFDLMPEFHKDKDD